MATEVVAALIRRDGRILICQRPPRQSHPLKWEFVGGKIEPGETPEQALARECREELGIEVQVGGLFMEVTHDYPDKTVHLRLYESTILSGEPQKIEPSDLRWVTPAELTDFPFCEADVAILERLQQL